jgi:hypothetical protein
MAEVSLQGPGVRTLVGERLAGRVSKHMGIALISRPAACAARSIIRRKPDTLKGAPRSLRYYLKTKTNRSPGPRIAARRLRRDVQA